MYQIFSRRRRAILTATALAASAASVTPPPSSVAHAPRPAAHRIGTRPFVVRSIDIGGAPLPPPPPPPSPPGTGGLQSRVTLIRNYPFFHRPSIVIGAKGRLPDAALQAAPVAVVHRPVPVRRVPPIAVGTRTVRAPQLGFTPPILVARPVPRHLPPPTATVRIPRPTVPTPPRTAALAPGPIRPAHPASIALAARQGPAAASTSAPRPLPSVVAVPIRPHAIPRARIEGTVGTAAIAHPLPAVVSVPRRVPAMPPRLIVPRAKSQLRPSVAVAPVPHRVRPVPRAIAPALRQPLASTAIAGPMPVVRVARRPPRIWLAPRPTVVAVPQPIPAVNPPTPGVPVVPPDLVAACIAWLRIQPAVVAAFGDSAATPKFFSDIDARGTQPPWLGFSEPDGEETYDTKDDSGRMSSLEEGDLLIAVTAGGGAAGKVALKALADLVAATLADAPLTFADGALVYFRRARRRFPIFAEPGPAGNVQLYRCLIHFKYQIERWAPASP